MGRAYLVIEGYIAKQPEVKTTTTGKLTVGVSIAHDTGKREENKPPIWFNIRTFNAAALNLEHANKGAKVRMGRCVPEEWTDREGNKRLSWVAFDDVTVEGNQTREKDLTPALQELFDEDSVPF